MENSASKESDPIEELKEYLNDEGKDDDPYTLLEDWLDDDDDEPKKKRRKKKTTARFSSVKRDKFGKRSYPYSGKKRYQVKKKLEQDSKTIPRHELSTPAFIFDDQYLPDTAFEDLPEETAKKKKRSWKERMERIEKAWSEEKENIFSSLRLKSAFLSKEKCALCLSKTAAVDCHECRIHLCEICDRDIHNKNPLHNRFSFVNDKTQALTPMQALNDNLEIYTVDRLVPLRHAVCICGSNNFEEIVKQGNVVVITMTGSLSPAKPSRCQQMLLLKHQLDQFPSNACPASKELLKKIELPDLSDLKIPILLKSKPEKESILSTVWDNEVSSTQINGELDKSTILVPAFQNAIQSCRYEMLHWNIKLQKYADSAKLRIGCRAKFTESNKKLKCLLERFVTVKSSEECSEFELIKESNHRLLLELNAKKERCIEEIDLLIRDMESYLIFYTSKIAELSAKADTSVVFEDKESGECQLGISFAKEQLEKGFTCFASVLPLEKIEYYQSTSGVNYKPCAEEREEHEEEDEEEEVAAVAIETAAEELEDLGIDHLDVEMVQSLGSDLLGSFDVSDCTQGDSFVILPERLGQGRLNGRNGSNACCVISILTGYFMSQRSNINFVSSVPLFVGCIEVGNTLHEEAANLLVQEAIDLVPVDLHVLEERGSLPKDLNEVITYLFLNARIIIVTCNHQSICLVRPTNNEKVFLFDSHQHVEMGPLIAWSEEDIADIIEYIPFKDKEDQIYLCSIQH